MPPLLTPIVPIEPMPLAVRPRRPPLALRPPLKVLATEGLSTHTPPSFLFTVSRPFPPMVSSFVSCDVTMLKSVLIPRSSSVLACAVTFGKIEVPELLTRFARTRGPEPLASMRRVPEVPVR